MDETAVRRELTAAALSSGLGRAEVQRTLSSGWRAGLRHPRRHGDRQAPPDVVSGEHRFAHGRDRTADTPAWPSPPGRPLSLANCAMPPAPDAGGGTTRHSALCSSPRRVARSGSTSAPDRAGNISCSVMGARYGPASRMGRSVEVRWFRCRGTRRSAHPGQGCKRRQNILANTVSRCSTPRSSDSIGACTPAPTCGL
jgi:hypothetical protein